MERQLVPPVPGARLVGPLGPRKGPANLGEYVDLLNRRQVASPAAETNVGPLSSPVQTVGPTAEELLRAIYDNLRMLPADIIMQARTQLLLTPREDVPIFAAARAVSITNGAKASVLSYTIPEGYTGFLEFLGLAVIPDSAGADIAWQLQINGNIHPDLTSFVCPQSNLLTPWKFKIELSRSKKVELFATNSGLAPLNVSALFLGSKEVITTEKPYGGTSMNGVA